MLSSLKSNDYNGLLSIAAEYSNAVIRPKEKLSKIELFGILIFISGVSLMLLTRTS